MAQQTLSYLKEKFETGDLPTQQDFIDLIDTLSDTQLIIDETNARTAADTTLQSNIDTHASLTNNPHQVTAGQTGAYTKAEIDTALGTKANQTTTYTKTEVDGAVSAAVSSVSASSINVYTKPETDTRIQAIIDTAPASLDTLNELAAALGDDANFAGTVTTQLALKAPLANPAFTGLPTAPTATAGTNNTQIATTQFVKAEIASSVPAGLIQNSPTIQTTSFSAVANTSYFIQGIITVTLPANPAMNDIVEIIPADGGTGAVINPSGLKIMGISENLTLDTANVCIKLRYSNTTYGWRIC